MQYNIELTTNNRRVLTDGHTPLDCHTIYRIVGVLKELAVCNCNASISDGFLILEDGTSYDLEKLVRVVTT